MKPLILILAGLLAASPSVSRSAPDDSGGTPWPFETEEYSPIPDETDRPPTEGPPAVEPSRNVRRAELPGKKLSPPPAAPKSKKPAAPGRTPAAAGPGSKTRISPKAAPAPAASKTAGASPKPPSTKKVIPVNRKQAPAVVRTELVKGCNPASTSVVVDLGRQRAYLLIDNQVAVDTPISTGKTTHRTKTGTFRVTERVRTGKISNKYGSAMPYWQRIGASPIGLHTGSIPGYPASHSCVRLPAPIAPIFFSCLKSGTVVRIVSQWNPKNAAVPAALARL